MLQSRLPPAGANLFQEIKERCVTAEANDKTLIRLSIGQPTGAPLVSARTRAAVTVRNGAEAIHEYQDNGSPGIPGFAQEFCQAHIKTPLGRFKRFGYLPIPGIKPMLGLIPLACGCTEQEILVRTMTEPGYPTPEVWCHYLGLDSEPLITSIDNKFRFSTKSIPPGTNLVMTNYPANPHGQVATEAFWHKICAHCQEHDIRLFNDGAYALLAWSPAHCTLADVAIHYPKLSWAEAFSASKVGGNMTGWRIGAIIGSKDFVGDIATIKGNTDSGFFAPAAAGVIHAIKTDMPGILKIREMYQQRITTLIDLLEELGMQITIVPGAGFFTLWKTPKKAFGRDIEDGKHFNYLMIEKTGIVGVHFGPFIRYAVVAPIDDLLGQIKSAFKQANVKY